MTMNSKQVDTIVFKILPGMSVIEHHVTRTLNAKRWLDEHPDLHLAKDYPFYRYMFTEEVVVAIGWQEWPTKWLEVL